jgi:hypothetical protein
MQRKRIAHHDPSRTPRRQLPSADLHADATQGHYRADNHRRPLHPDSVQPDGFSKFQRSHLASRLGGYSDPSCSDPGPSLGLALEACRQLLSSGGAFVPPDDLF